MTTQLTAENFYNIIRTTLKPVPSGHMYEIFRISINEKWIEYICEDLDEQHDGICKKYELIPNPEQFKADLTKIYFGNTNQ